jgi:aminoglycoside phosphotransferase family enzyme
MKLTEALQLGLVENIPKPERHIETWISDIFLYEKVARKVVKHLQDKDIGDFRNKNERRDFSVADFSWNRLFTPEVYVELQGARKTKEAWELCGIEEADEFIVFMNRIDADDTLVNRLVRKKLSDNDIARLTETLLEKLDLANKKYFEDQSRKLKKNLYQLMIMRMDNFADFLLSAGSVSKKLTNARIDSLRSFHSSESYFQELGPSSASVTIDAHSSNIVFVQDKPVFIDVYWPMPFFRIIDRALAVARLASCVRIFMGDKPADKMYDVFARERELPPKQILRFYEAYSAFVMGYYFIHIKRPELVDKYLSFADMNLASLKK